MSRLKSRYHSRWICCTTLLLIMGCTMIPVTGVTAQNAGTYPFGTQTIPFTATGTDSSDAGTWTVSVYNLDGTEAIPGAGTVTLVGTPPTGTGTINIGGLASGEYRLALYREIDDGVYQHAEDAYELHIAPAD